MSAAEDTQCGTQFSNADLDLFLQWFNIAQDLCQPGYLERRDFALAVRLYRLLGRRVPHSVLKGAGLPVPGEAQNKVARRLLDVAAEMPAAVELPPTKVTPKPAFLLERIETLRSLLVHQDTPELHKALKNCTKTAKELGITVPRRKR